MAEYEATRKAWEIAEKLGTPVPEHIKLYETLRDEFAQITSSPIRHEVAELFVKWFRTRNPHFVDKACAMCHMHGLFTETALVEIARCANFRLAQHRSTPQTKTKQLKETTNSPAWQKYRLIPHLEIWKVAALSLDIDPEEVKITAREGMTIRKKYSHRSGLFSERLEVTLENATSGTFGEIQKAFAYTPIEERKISVANFAGWAISVGLDIPADLASLAAKTPPKLEMSANENNPQMPNVETEGLAAWKQVLIDHWPQILAENNGKRPPVDRVIEALKRLDTSGTITPQGGKDQLVWIGEEKTITTSKKTISNAIPAMIKAGQLPV